MTKTVIYTLGKFEIYVKGKDIVKFLENSKKKIILIQYLIVNMDRDISTQELYDVLWPGGENTNPENALKTLVSRLRVNLSQLGLEKAIVTKRRLYKWNPALGARIDLYEFSDLCAATADAFKLNISTEKKSEQILLLSRGELLSSAGHDAWASKKRMECRRLYMDAVNRYIGLLNDENRYEDTMRVAKDALEIDAFDSNLNLHLMTAYLKLGKKKEALAQYNYATGNGGGPLRGMPTDEMLEFYKRMLINDYKSSEDIHAIVRELCLSEKDDAGAYVCDYVVFKDIYKLNAKNLRRLGTAIYLALINLDTAAEEEPSVFITEKTMRLLIDILKNGLRKGDTIARYAINQIAVLLPGVTHETGAQTLERIKGEFYGTCACPGFIMKYKILPVLPDN
jgi:DNA-binding SARP family transcriptional activator